ncbi:MAG: YkgJ family cysteine cluster protein [Candidatus Helarchaeota archaeon]
MKIYRFECQKCGLCCRNKNLIVTLTHRDLLSIYYGLKMKNVKDLLKIVAFYQVDVNNKELMERLIYPVFYLKENYMLLGLFKINQTDCIYLKDNKCSIYELRPQICRIFPFTFVEKSNHLKLQVNSIASEICIGLNKGNIVDMKSLRNLWKKIIEEKEEYEKLISIWNNLVFNGILDPDPITFLNFILGNIKINI